MRTLKSKLSQLLACYSAIAVGAGWVSASPVIGGLEHSQLDERSRGLVLLGELNCAACHNLGGVAGLIRSKPAPDLRSISSRVQFDWLKEYIVAPHSLKPGTTMPDMVSHLSDSDRADVAEAIAHYLVSLDTKKHAGEVTEQFDAGHGKELYHSIGCVACHAPGLDDASSVPLGKLADKYSRSGLVEFLKDPLASRPSGRMPRFELEHQEALDIAAYLLTGTSNEVQPIKADANLVGVGKIHFQNLGCVSCHSQGLTETIAKVSGGDLNDLSVGCFSGTTGEWPAYALTENQIGAIRSALSTEDLKLADEQRIRLTITQLNCVACHERGGFGGVGEDRDQWFQSHDPNVGEQGRIPPTLTGVGAKLNPVMLRKVLVEGAPVRPYLKTRMPQFGAENVEELIALFEQEDTLPQIDDVMVGRLNDFKNAGQKLVGNEAFSCIACHSFKGRKTGSMAVVDLTEMGQRLKRDWFVSYLLDPQKFSPSTLMPGFWPGGASSYTDLFDGDGVKQVSSIWTYLGDGYGAGQPRGLYREPMRLLATDHAQMLRRSYRGVGKRGIGVGYPEGVNIIFNAEQMCLSAIWKGEFLDPAGVWTSQGHGTARPLNRPIELTNEPELNGLPDRDSSWPEAADRPAHLQFKGYTLDERRQPTFRYALENVAVDDFISARGPEDGKSVLRRELDFRSTGDKVSGLVFRAATNERVIALDDQTFQIGDGLVIGIVEGGGLVIPTADGKTELRIPIEFTNGRAQVTIDYIW